MYLSAARGVATSSFNLPRQTAVRQVENRLNLSASAQRPMADYYPKLTPLLGSTRSISLLNFFQKKDPAVVESQFVHEGDKNTVKIEYHLDQIMGWGAHGQVLKTTDDQQYVVKTFPDHFTQEDREREARVLMKGENPRVMKLVGVSRDTEGKLISIALEKGAISIDDFVRLKQYKAFRKSTDIQTKEKVLMTSLKHALEGLLHLHKKNLVHKDLYPRHIMLFSDGFKLIDVGAGRNTTNPEYGREKDKVDDFVTLAKTFKEMISMYEQKLTGVIAFLDQIEALVLSSQCDPVKCRQAVEELVESSFSDPSKTMTAEQLHAF